MHSRLFVATTLLCIITVVFFIQTDAYTQGTHNLLPDYQKKGLLRLSKSDQGAEITGVTNNEVWQLSTTPAFKTSWIDMDISSPWHHDALFLSANISAIIEPGSRSENHVSANLMLLSTGTQRVWDYRVPNRLTTITSTQDWSHYAAGFKLDPGAVRYRISANLTGLTGSLFIKNITLYSAEQNVFYNAGYYSLLLGWALLLIYLCVYVSRHVACLYEYWPLLGIVAFIIVGILLPADIKHSLLTQLQAMISVLGVDFPVPGADVSTHILASPLLPLDKTGHLIAFGIAGFILAWKGKSGYKEYLPALILFAISTETLQFFIPGRNPLMMDVAIDTAGIIAGTSLAYLLKRVV